MKIFKYVLRTLSYILSIVIVLLILVAAITQTGFFKNRLKIILSSNFSTSTHTQLYIGSIRGNIITGLEIDSVSVDDENGNILSARSISVNHDPFALFKKTILVNHIIIEQPSFHFTRAVNGRWNFENILSPSEDTIKSQSHWLIILNDVTLQNGTLSLSDSASLTSSDHKSIPGTLEYHNFSMNDVNLHFSVAYQHEELSAVISSITCHVLSPDVMLKRFSGEFKANSEGLGAHNVIIQTNKSALRIDASIKGPNVFKGFDIAKFQYDPANVRLSATNIDFDEFKTLLPAVEILKGTPSVELDASGQFGNLQVKRLDIQTGSSSLKLFGNIRNLHQPKELYLDVVIGDSKVDPSDATKLLPTTALPSFKKSGLLSLYGQYKGQPTDFNTAISLKGTMGEIELKGHMNVGGEFPKYELTYTTKNFNVGDITDEASLKSGLFAHGECQGEGLALKDIIGHFNLTVDSGKIQNIVFGNSTVDIKAWTHRYDVTSSIKIRGMNADITASLDIEKPSVPQWNSRFSINSLDLAKIFPELKSHTNLELQGTAKGSGKSIDGLNAEIAASFKQSTINRKEFPAQDITLSLDQHDANNKHFSISSSILDADVKGKFDIDLLANILADRSASLIDKIVRHASGRDTFKIINKEIAASIEHHTEEQQRQDLTYSATIKNLEPIAAILSDKPFNARGNLNGSIRGTEKELSVSCNGLLDEFYVGTSERGFLLKKSQITLAVDNIQSQKMLEQLSALANISVQSGQINSMPVDNVEMLFNYGDVTGNYKLKGRIDSLYSIALNGMLSFQPQTYVFDFDSLTIDNGNYSWQNENDVQLRLNNLGMRVMHATMKHENESFSFAGSWDSLENYNVDISLREVQLGELNSWFGSFESQRATYFTGKATGDIHLTGTPQSPVLDISAAVNNLTYKHTPVGNITVSASYENKLAVLNMTVHSSQQDTTPHLYIKGEIPVDLAFKGVQERFPSERQEIQIVSDNFNISALEPLFPEFGNLNGLIKCDITVTGTPRNPEYVGAISIHEAKFTLSSNNVSYIVSGDLEPLDERLVLKNFIIKNTPEDRPDGEARVEGFLTLKDFQLDSLDLTVYGQLLVMSEATRQTIQTMYGTEFIAMGQEGLRITQTYEHPKLSGRIFIREQNITFPPTRESAVNYSSLSLNYVIVDDTVKHKHEQSGFSQEYYIIPAQEESTVTKKSNASDVGLLQRMSYDLVIETQGPTRVKMIFTPATNEELYAELEGKVTLVSPQGTPNVYGEISIAPRSYYNFLKHFSATGTLKYIGPWDNPQLNIIATYEGIHAKNDTLNQKVNVQLDITGSRFKPQLQMSMKIQPEPGKDFVDWATQGKGNDVQSDAISYIMTGKFRDELTSRDKESILTSQSTSSSVLSGFTTTFLSGMLTDFLHKEFPFIRSAEVSYRGGNLQESADLRLSGEAFNGYWRFGGRILNDIGNANVNYQVSLGNVLNTTSIRNLFIELEHKAEGSEFGEDRRLSNAARIYYRFSF